MLHRVESGCELLEYAGQERFHGAVYALSLVCNAESCKAIKIYNFSVPKDETDRVRKVVVVFRNRQYQLTIEKSPPPKTAK